VAAVTVRVLGQVEAEVDGIGVPLTQTHRRLLARLVVAGSVVTAEDLAELLGTDRAPVTTSTVKSHVSRLRASLGGGAVVSSTAGGYRLQLAPGSIDRDRFEALLRATRGAPAAVESWRLGQALGLWRGPAFGDLATEWFAMSEAVRLEELRLVAIERRVDADLALGRHEALIAELRGLTLQQPLREKLHRQLARALAGAGREVEALRTLAQLRAAIAEETGLEPAEETAELERKVLARDRSLVPSRRGAGRSLPAPLTPLVGRSAEVVRVADLVSDRRLTVLTGLGGVGKTRIADAAARSVADRFGSGVVFVDVARAADDSSILSMLGSALRIRAASTEELLALIAAEHLLIVLDGCEHRIDTARALVERLLPGSPTVHVLATSRQPLRVTGEVVVPVEGLPAAESAALFVARAADAGTTIPVDAESVRQLCAILDGLPLAIELAAARVRHTSVAELVAATDQRFEMLQVPGAGRHSSLLALLDESWTELDALQRELLAAAATFVGPATADAIAFVADGGADATAPREGLAALVDRSLVVATIREDGPSLFHLLDTVRAFARRRARATEAARAERHARWYLAAAERGDEVHQALSSVRAEELAAHQADLEVAVRTLLDRGDLAVADRLLAATATLWRSGSGAHFAFARQALERALLAPIDSSTAVAGHGLLAFLTRMQVDNDASEQHARVGIQRGTTSGWMAFCWSALGLRYAVRGTSPATESPAEVARARWAISQARACLGSVDVRWRLFVGWDIANVHFTLGEIENAHAELAGALAAVGTDPDLHHDETLVRACDSLALHLLGRDRDAVAVAGPVLSTLEGEVAGSGWLANQPRAFVAPALAAAGDPRRATQLILEATPRAAAVSTELNTGDFIVALAAVEAVQGNWRRAAQLLGAARALGLRHPIPFRTPMGLALYRHWNGRVREALGAEVSREERAFGARAGVSRLLEGCRGDR
jgi:predicted ATPase/DNA-binding SARP family transcriptional activator